MNTYSKILCGKCRNVQLYEMQNLFRYLHSNTHTQTFQQQMESCVNKKPQHMRIAVRHSVKMYQNQTGYSIPYFMHVNIRTAWRIFVANSSTYVVNCTLCSTANYSLMFIFAICVLKLMYPKTHDIRLVIDKSFSNTFTFKLCPCNWSLVEGLINIITSVYKRFVSHLF